MNLYRFRCVLATLAALGLTACQTPSPQQGVAPPVQARKPAVPLKAATPANQPSAPYSNSQYHFTCKIPEGFVLTNESEGPGEIMTLVPTSMSSNATATLSLRTAKLGSLTLDQYMDSRITRDLKGDSNVTRSDKFPASYGAFSGFEVAVERQYASGPFKSRVFGFTHGNDVFILNYSASADQFDSDQQALSRFLESLVFSS